VAITNKPPANTSQQLTEQMLEDFANPNKKAKGVKLSTSTGISFNADLQRIVREIKKDINEQLMPMLRQLAPQYQTDDGYIRDSMPTYIKYTHDNWVTDVTSMLRRITEKWSSPEFKAIAARLSNTFISTADKVNRERFGKDMQRFGIDIFGDSPELVEYVQASLFDTTRLITSIPDQYLTQVESIVMTNIRAGGRPSAIAKSLKKQFDITEGRAKMIARDQTAKVNGDLAAKRQQSSGFEYFQWLDSDDEKVRDRHEDIANKVTAYGKGIYRWDHPPLSAQGVPIIPGQDYQCRCIARPVLASEAEENQKAGRVVKGVKR
jgi:SPP1 gp7 family putative phage head morphogenesis protein